MGFEGLIFLIPLGGMAVGALFLVGVYKLTTRWMDHRQIGSGKDVSDEVARLRSEVESLQDVGLRVGELEERLDFAERLLTQQQRDSLSAGE